MTAAQATILAALIAVAGTVLGALITIFGPQLVQALRSKDRRFTRKWVGTAKDVAIPEHLSFDHSLNYELTLELTRRGELVSGRLFMRSNEPKKFSGHCKVKSIGVSGDYLAFKYALTDQDVSHFGVAFLELREAGRELHGFFLSKKIFEKKLGFGAMTLKKT